MSPTTNVSKRRRIDKQNAGFEDPHTVEARKASAELNKASTSYVDVTSFHTDEASEMLLSSAAKLVARTKGLQEKNSQDAAESSAKITKLTRDLEEAQKKLKLEMINCERAERLVEQARQEKYMQRLKSSREKACLKRKILELETELQHQEDRFNNALLDAEVNGYNKCVNKAKEKGLRYKKLLLDPMHDPTDNQQENMLLPPPAKNCRDLDNVPDSTNTIPTVLSKEKALFDPAGPMFYSSIIEVLAKKNLEGQVGSMVSKKGDTGTQKPPSSSLNISENHKQLKNGNTELERIKDAAFILGYNKCAESIRKSKVYDPSKHSIKDFVASEVVRLEISTSSS
ncbi:uncharacterized protein LOC135151307 isoform X1 [Daucus carota subsp. sativus]|uniref:uncharacterized protein LOC135151307 isoform X1 n=2 Tax=Daucus carota subsp. sativus TaxID=79200 RepID=UPI003083B697